MRPFKYSKLNGRPYALSCKYSMQKPTKRSAVYEDLFDLPDNIVGEIFSGELITHPRPAPKHARAASAVGAVLFNKFDLKPPKGEGGWWILYEPECHLGDDILVPAIAGWRKSTMPELPETAWFGMRPDSVCEVVSPSTAKYDRGIKRDCLLYTSPSPRDRG